MSVKHKNTTNLGEQNSTRYTDLAALLERRINKDVYKFVKAANKASDIPRTNKLLKPEEKLIEIWLQQFSTVPHIELSGLCSVFCAGGMKTPEPPP